LYIPIIDASAALAFFVPAERTEEALGTLETLETLAH
jgi:hypothetical protein